VPHPNVPNFCLRGRCIVTTAGEGDAIDLDMSQWNALRRVVFRVTAPL
jgi:hypothetical protein